jgi:hypothetical protein
MSYPGQTQMVVIPAAELRQGDCIPVGFVGYGEVSCPVVSARVRESGGFAGRLVDVSACIGEGGPLFGTVVRTDEHFTVIR